MENKPKEIDPQVFLEMAEAEFGGGSFADWYNHGGMQGD